VGKPRTYETDDGTVNVSVRPESIQVVDAATRDRWVVETAERTLDRISAFEDEGNEYGRMAREEYDIPIERYVESTVSALESVEESDSDELGAAGDADPEADLQPEP
jgi:RPA family protein